jgi:hypothetical protein
MVTKTEIQTSNVLNKCFFGLCLAIALALPTNAEGVDTKLGAEADATNSKAEVSTKQSANLPKGWFPAGSHPGDYLMAVDKVVVHSGAGSATIKSIVPEPKGFGTLMQQCAPGDYREKRVRFSSYIKSKDVTGWAGLWFRVDGGKARSLRFDNMQDRPIKGTKDWTKCENVLDVPKESTNLAYGVLLSGGGQVWFDDVNFEIVDKSVPTTDVRGGNSKPSNLKFED